MHKPFFLFSFFLIVSLILILSVQADPDTETLYVDGFNSINEEWTEVGSSPWLNNNTANEIYTKTDEYWHEEFTFANSGVDSGTINGVYLYVEMKGDSGRNDYADYFIHDGTSWTSVLQQDDDTGTYTWYSVDISTIMDTWTKIDSAKLKIQYQRAGSPNTVEIYVRRAYLYVDYTAGGQNYVADLSQSISFTWNILTETDFNVVASQSITTSWSILTQWNAIADFSQALTTSWDALAKWDVIVDFSQAVATSWQFLASHNMFVDLSQAVSTTWSILTQWNAIVDLTQAVSTSWEVLTQSTFNVVTSLSTAFTWVVDAVLGIGQQYIVDLTQVISVTWHVVIEWGAYWRMQISFEILIMLNVSILFTIAFLLSKELRTRLILGSINIIAWFALALAFVASQPSFPIFAFVFFLVGLIFTITLIHDSISMFHEKRWKTEMD